MPKHHLGFSVGCSNFGDHHQNNDTSPRDTTVTGFGAQSHGLGAVPLRVGLALRLGLAVVLADMLGVPVRVFVGDAEDDCVRGDRRATQTQGDGQGTRTSDY